MADIVMPVPKPARRRRRGYTMRGRGGFLIVLFAFWPTIAFPQNAFLSGNDLYDDCTAPRGGDKHLSCVNYVMGVADALLLTRNVCIPKSAAATQAVDVVTNYLRAHAEVRTYTAASITGVALREAFRCGIEQFKFSNSK